MSNNEVEQIIKVVRIDLTHLAIEMNKNEPIFHRLAPQWSGLHH